MSRLIVRGGTKLQGELEVYNAKNCVLALLAASILTEEKVILHKCPMIADVYSMIKILDDIGVKVEWQNDSLLIDSQLLNRYEISPNYAKEVRSSIFLMGSILGRLKKVNAVFPGGCDIGLRPIDLHLKGLRALNISIQEYGGYLYCDGQSAHGGAVHLDFPSVGATENIILASVLLDGITVITNVAKEPEIVALQDFLVAMGAHISGAGTSTIVVEGVKKLHGVEFTPIPDRIIAGTYLIAGAFTGGDLLIKNCRPQDMKALISKMDDCCGRITEYHDCIHIKSVPRPTSIKAIETQPFPGFPTDLQTQILALQTISNGVSMIVENIFETRFKHVAELTKLGADIVVRDRVALVRGVKTLRGAEVFAHDLRGGAALVLAGLRAEGQTVINNIRHIDRGYYKLDEALNSVGADIVREVDL
ncbi:MAG: UDP-N-acetylglucosamine 1-carboxyvinyltransferase [Clostridia bacterium]|nr:UDP-N-acetylglucosamine 1-carboxyvinyltransferase [Clostridia bacterium]MDD3832266.1 UDP-N-acetylglucosamine 1-carboxyvinyltransferase [Clostridia bacterium]